MALLIQNDSVLRSMGHRKRCVAACGNAGRSFELHFSCSFIVVIEVRPLARISASHISMQLYGEPKEAVMSQRHLQESVGTRQPTENFAGNPLGVHGDLQEDVLEGCVLWNYPAVDFPENGVAHLDLQGDIFPGGAFQHLVRQSVVFIRFNNDCITAVRLGEFLFRLLPITIGNHNLFWVIGVRLRTGATTWIGRRHCTTGLGGNR